MTSSASSVVELPPAGNYHIDPAASSVSFATRHFFGLGAARGSFGLREGTLHVADPVTESSASAVVSASSFDTGVSARDGMVRSPRYLDVERHPDITFASTRLAEADGRWELHGSLTVRGLTRPLTLAIEEAHVDGTRVRVRASTRVDRYDFGITAQKGLTGRYLTMSLDVTADSTGSSSVSS